MNIVLVIRSGSDRAVMTRGSDWADPARRQRVSRMERQGGAACFRKAGARPRKARGRPDRKGSPKGVSQTPGALPALHSPVSGEEKGNDGAPGAGKEYGR